jgi:predicted Zn-dependent protease
MKNSQKNQKIHELLQLAIGALLIASLNGCGTPVTKEIALNKNDLQREEQAQKDMARKYPPKKLSQTQHKDLAAYQARMNKVAPPLMRAAQQICTDHKCNYTFKIANEPVLNAWADGKTVNVTPMMMDFLDSDKELALILAHELSHNIMGHIAKKQKNVLYGTLADIAARVGGVDTGGAFSNVGAMSYSQGFENEADYVAIYIMAIAGYDVSDINQLWRKMSVQTPQSIRASFFSSHPSNAERFLRMQKAIDEVLAKKAAGQKLLPNFKT